MMILLTLAAGLVVLTVLIHLAALLGIRDLVVHLPGPRTKVAAIVLAAISAHLVEISCFAVAIRGLVHSGTQGALHGALAEGFRDYFYFSAVTFSSLGYGDLTPVGHLRVFAAVEALTGIVLITWSASFTFLAMQRYWGQRSPEGE